MTKTLSETIKALRFPLMCFLLPDMVSGKNVPISEYGVKDFIIAFWDTSSLNTDGLHQPIAHHLWFVRDLFVVCLLSPVIFIFLRWFHLLGLLILLLTWVLGIESNLPGLSTTAIVPFSVGAYFSRKSIDFGHVFSRYVMRLVPLYLAGLVIENERLLEHWGGNS